MSDTERDILLSFAAEICTGCICYEGGAAEGNQACKHAPCPYFAPGNFYYDTKLRRLWCCNWLDANGNTRPLTPAVA